MLNGFVGNIHGRNAIFTEFTSHCLPSFRPGSHSSLAEKSVKTGQVGPNWGAVVFFIRRIGNSYKTPSMHTLLSIALFIVRTIRIVFGQQPCADFSYSIVLWLTIRWELYNGPCPNLLRGDRAWSSSPLIVTRVSFSLTHFANFA